ncbi:MAG: hypothetical protein Q4C96_03920 [Planctomycetia bacterium]|nr:hypothetical protein [Planctomycetia bacterium]
MTDHTPFQQNIIKKYYKNLDVISVQRLGELATELFLSTGKKRINCWKRAEAAMIKLNIPQSRIEHILASDDPTLLARLVQEIGHK